MKNKVVLAGLMVSILLGGCSKNEQDKNYRVGTELSQAYVDPKKKEVLDMKAKDFEYDYDNLEYMLVWSDEFEYEGLPDPKKWNYDTGGSGWGNHELQYYTDDKNASVSNGLLTIEARKESFEGMDYTSARMVTRGKGDWLYGKFEIRAKLPTGKGTWPAIWMLSTDWEYGSWPASGEIDIMEHVGYDQDRIHASAHTQSYHHSINTQKTATKVIKGVSDEFHTYTLEWLPDQLKAYIDEELFFTFKPVDYKANPTFKEWPFDKKMHLLLNIAAGGDWGGSQGVDESIWPQKMEVDYVRVYQSEEITNLTKTK